MVYYIINLFLAIFQCVPLAKTFNRLAPGTCFDNDANLIAVAIFAVLSYFAILLLPCHMDLEESDFYQTAFRCLDNLRCGFDVN